MFVADAADSRTSAVYRRIASVSEYEHLTVWNDVRERNIAFSETFVDDIGFIEELAVHRDIPVGVDVDAISGESDDTLDIMNTLIIRIFKYDDIVAYLTLK